MAVARRFPSSIAILIGAMVLIPAGAVLGVRAFTAPAASRPIPPQVATATPPPPIVDEGAPELRGHILDPAGNPVPGASVHVLASSPAPGSSGALLATTTSDATGSFTVAHLGAAGARVRVEAEHDPEGAVLSAGLHPVDGETTEVTLVLAAAGIGGTVVDAAGKPVTGASLSVEGVPWSVATVASDDAGAFRFPVVAFTASGVVAVAGGYRTARVSLPTREDQPEPVLQIQLQAAPPADGDVLDPDGKPVRARVVACEGQAAEARVVSEEDGTFRLPPSAIGCEAVAVHDELGPSDAVVVAEGQRTVLRLRAGGSIEGVVVDARGAPAPKFSVGVESFVGAHGASSRGLAPRAFEGGAFRWGALAPGTYVLTAVAPGAPPTRSDPVEVRGGAATRGVRIVLSAGGTVRGHVYDDRHAPVPGVRLSFDRVSTTVESSASATTDDGGAFRLEAAPAGLFTLLAQKDGYRTRFLSGLHVDSGGTLTQDVLLTVADGGASFELGGIGAGLAARADGVELVSVFPGDPADRAGLRPGDRVTRIDGDDTAGMSISDALQRLRGEPGTSVGVSVRRKGESDSVDVVIVRATIAH